MTRLIFDRDEELVQWAQETYPDIGQINLPARSIGIASSEGKILGVAIYNNFAQNRVGQTYDLQITFVASTRWATKQIIRSILHYPFYQLGVKRMSAITDKSNKKARKLLEGIGFKLEGTHPFGDNGERPSLSYGLYRDEAIRRWFDG